MNPDPALTPEAIKAVVTGYWHANAHRYDTAPEHVVTDPEIRQRWLDLLEGSLPTDRAPLDVVDLGCGTGYLSLLVAALGHRVIGIDHSTNMLTLAADKAAAAGFELDLRQGDVDALALDDASVDVVVERHVLWTMVDPAATLREWRRVLRPGGRILHVGGDWSNLQPRTTSTRDDPYSYRTVEHALRFATGARAEEIVPLFAAAGFADLAVTPLDEREYWEAHDLGAPVDRYLLVGRAA